MNSEQEMPQEWQIEKQKSLVRVDLNQNQKRIHIQRLIDQVDRSRLRVKRKPSRFFMENEYVHGGYLATLPKSCTAVFLPLLVHCNSDTQVAFPSISTIQALSGCTNRNTVIKAIKILREYGIVSVLKSKGFNMVNVYAFQAVKFWKPIPGWKERLEKYNNKSQYQFNRHRSIKRNEYRSSRDDTRTNLSENSPNTITNIGDILRKKMQEMQMQRPQDKVAIQDPSGHSVVSPAKHDPIPVIAGNLREYRSNTGDTAEKEDFTVKKGWKNGEATPEPPISSAYEGAETNNMGHIPNDPNIKSAYE